LATNTTITIVVAEPVKAAVRGMAVERAEHTPEPVRVLAWL
jgi:hypothetical protein